MTTENETPESVVLTGIADPALRASLTRPASVIVDIWSPKTGAKFCITGHGMTAKEALQDVFEAIEYAKTVGLTTEFPGADFQNQYGCITRKEHVAGQPAGKPTNLPKAEPEYVPPVSSLPKVATGATRTGGETPPSLTGAWNPAESKSVLFGEKKRNPKNNKVSTYWQVTNLPRTKFAVAIWPEVLLEAGIDVEQLSLDDQYPLDFTHGEFENNEKGYPGKITLLSYK